MSTTISNRAQKTPPSPIRSLVGFANDAQDRGVHVHKLNIGQPDLNSPIEFLDAIHTYNESVVAYDASPGNNDLIKNWCTKLNTQYNLSIQAKDMVITAGSSEALTFVFSICCDVNDDILVFDPTYANYGGFAALAGINLIPVECAFDSGFHLPTRQIITNALTETTKAILVCNPNNPTGTTLTHEELKMLVSICDEYDLFLIVDEVYREFVYTSQQPISILQVAKNNTRVVVVDSISKRYSLCGARVGCIISHNAHVMQAANNLASTRVSAPTIEQVATAQMLATLDSSYLDRAVQEYSHRRIALMDALKVIPGVSVTAAEGGFYVLAKLPVADAEDFARFLLRDFSYNNETVFVAPAAGFYITPHGGKDCVRIAFVLEVSKLVTCATILHKALEVYTALKTLP